jgi:hypothetical protein
MQSRLLAACAAMVIVACGPSLAIGPGDLLSRSGYILNPDEAMTVLHPCSRPLPAVDSLWTPSRSDVLALEALLPRAVKQLSWDRPSTGPEKPLSAYVGSYAGYYRDGQRFVYGDFADLKLGGPNDTNIANRLFGIDCGESRNRFGVTYIVSSGQILHIQMNQRGVNNSGVRFIIVDESSGTRELGFPRGDSVP